MAQEKKIRLHILAEPVRKADYLFFFVAAFLCALFFQQQDLLITAGGSLIYLNGHFSDLYAYATQHFTELNYLPTTYLVFALWNLPLRLIGLVAEPTITVSFFVLLWYKLLPCLTYLVSAYLIYLLAKESSLPDDQGKIGAFLFLTTPIGFFSQFIFGQYDIFSVCLMLLALVYWKKGVYWKFLLFFALSATFKYYTFLFFIPFLLLKEKDILKIFRDIALFTVPVLLEVLMYCRDHSFLHSVFGFGAPDYILETVWQTRFAGVSIPILIWAAICAFCYLQQPLKKGETLSYLVFTGMAVSFVLFGVSAWHPQWLLLMCPFLALLIVVQPRKKATISLELLMTAVFFGYVVNVWYGNVDTKLFELGILCNVLPDELFALPMKTLFIISTPSIWITVFSGILLILTIFSFPRFTCKSREPAELLTPSWLRSRFLLGIALFIVPAVISLLYAYGV